MSIENIPLALPERLELHARKVVEGFITGMHKSPYQGFSVEFAEHRPYNTGESTRHMDWKLLARTEKYYIKRYEAETNLRCWCVIDRSSSMRYPEERSGIDKPNKLWYAAKATAALFQMLKRQRDAFGLGLIGEKLEFLSEARLSTRHHRFLLNSLSDMLEDKAEKPVKTDLANSLHELAERISRRSLVLVFTDMFEPEEKLEELQAAFQHLQFRGHDVSVFHVHDRQTEMNLELGRQPLQLVDMETGVKMKIEPGQLRKHYTERAEAFHRRMKELCGRTGADWNEADIQQGMEPVFIEFLRKRGKMY